MNPSANFLAPAEKLILKPVPDNRLSRRRFLNAGATALMFAPMIASSRLSGMGPMSSLQHACIGVGGMGWTDLHNMTQHSRTQVVALCDVDANHLNRAAEVVPGARLYSDWRELLEQETGRVDSVNVTVPDHMHYPIAYSAIRAGMHVYCQKPMCHDLAEVRALTRAAEAAGVTAQLGTQAASGIGDRTAVQLLRRGVIGAVNHLYLCSNRSGAIETYRLPGPRPPLSKTELAPAHLNWDLWLGTAPSRPYAPDIYHPTKWRAWQDFGTGWSGDIGCHIFDAVWKGLDLKPATSVIARVQESWKRDEARRADTWPQSDHIIWSLPGNEFTETNELTVEWFDGLYLPPESIRALYPGERYPQESVMVIGTEGAMLVAYDSGPMLLPSEKFTGVIRPKLAPRNHYHHFLDACLGGESTESHFAQTGPMTENILLGTVAIREPDQHLDWNHDTMTIQNHRKAEHWLRRTYRSGWEII